MMSMLGNSLAVLRLDASSSLPFAHVETLKMSAAHFLTWLPFHGIVPEVK
jgi:hypothetical protein